MRQQLRTIVALLLLVAAPAVAQGEDSPEVYANEFILTTAPVEALQQKAVAEFSAVVGELAVVEDSGARNILVTTDPESLTEDAGSRNEDREEGVQGEESGEIVRLSRRDDACLRFDRARRSAIAAARRLDELPALSLRRAITCTPNVVIRAVATRPNDPRFGELWGLNSSADNDIDAPEGWDITTGSADVVIAVVDTGVDYNHPDLALNMWQNPGEVAGDGIDNDRNGIVDDVYGYNALAESGNPMDDNNHGTHCAGTIAGRGNDAIGVAGVSWNGKIMAVKFLGSSGSGSLYDSMQAVDYVTGMRLRGINVRVSSNSWGCEGCYYSPLLDAIRRARDAGLFFVAAAGNNSADTDTRVFYPAGFDVSNVIAVGASDINGDRAHFSNYGAKTVDLFAPGLSILSTIAGGGYASFSGTSMAAPHVAGALALLLSRYPAISIDQGIQHLLNTTRARPGLTGRARYGLLNIFNLLRLSPGEVPTPTPVPTATHTPTPRPTATPSPTPTPTSTPTPTPTPAPITQTVRVLGSDGAALAGATVRFSVNGSETVRYTDGNGYATLPNVFPGRALVVTVSLDRGWSFAEFRGVTSTTPVVITGARMLFNLDVRVLSLTGQPMAGVTLSEGTLGTRTTDGSGVARWQLPLGTLYDVVPSAAGATFPESAQGRMIGHVERVLIPGQ